MKIIFRLMWWKESADLHRAFKVPAYHSLFTEYRDRIRPFSSCEAAGNPAEWRTESSRRVWMCDRARGARPLDSEQVADQLQKVLNDGTRELHILIGVADGFGEKDDLFWKPSLKWSFGPLTLPHELALVVASEQIYRAWTILKRMPYHGAHETSRGGRR